MAKRIPKEKSVKGNGIERKKRSSLMKITAALPILPQEVIFFGIFCHLPAQFLLLLRSLCRSSLQLIDNPHFAQTHASLASAHLLFFVFNRYREPKFLSLQINRGRRNRLTCLENFKLGVPHGCMILASCNGLLLLRIIDSNTEGIVVANPAIKKWHMLPKPLAGKEGPYWDCLYSIVFDASSKLYKVVHLLLDLAGKLICEVITFGSPNQSWRRVDVPLPTRPGAIIDHKYNPFRLGQILFWVDGHSNMYPFNGVFNPSKHHIMSMDVVKEEFRRIKPPNFTTQICCLLDLAGKLALFNFDRIKIDAWVLQDYEGQVWMKKYSINNKRLLRYFWTHGWKIGFMLTASLHDGKVLIFSSRNKIYQYDIEYDLFAQVRTHNGYLGDNPQNAMISKPCVHVNSLIWL